MAETKAGKAAIAIHTLFVLGLKTSAASRSFGNACGSTLDSLIARLETSPKNHARGRWSKKEKTDRRRVYGWKHVYLGDMWMHYTYVCVYVCMSV
jgi:hypothetical protein